MLNTLLTALNDCVWALDADTQEYLFISTSICSVLEYTVEDFHKNKEIWNLIIDPRDLAGVMAASSNPLKEDWVEQTYRVKTRSGKIKLVNHKKCQVADIETGRRVILNVINDISDEKHAQEEIIWTKNNLEALINNTEDLIWSIDREGKYVYMNTAYRDRITYTVDKIPREGDDAYMHSGRTVKINKEWKSYYKRAFLGERYVTRHKSPHPRTKELSYFEVSFNPIYKKSKGEIIGVGCFARDITERLKTEKALIEQNERLRNIASLSSHELRRPVASMLGLINILDRKNFSNPDNEQIIEHLITVSYEIDEVIRVIVNKTFIDSPKGS